MNDVPINANSGINVRSFSNRAFTNGDGPEDPYDLITSMTNELDTYVWNKDPRMSKPIPKKPIWI
ncbi:unnamed protein product, partial [Nesidiocoris tenuis]